MIYHKEKFNYCSQGDKMRDNGSYAQDRLKVTLIDAERKFVSIHYRHAIY